MPIRRGHTSPSDFIDYAISSAFFISLPRLRLRCHCFSCRFHEIFDKSRFHYFRFERRRLFSPLLLPLSIIFFSPRGFAAFSAAWLFCRRGIFRRTPFAAAAIATPHMPAMLMPRCRHDAERFITPFS